MKFIKYLLNEDSLDMMYGGMPEGGGYDSNTEFEVGLQRYCEAAHCILGSLVKSGKSNHFWIEKGHIHEEIGIMKECVKEYSRDLYLDRVEEGLRENDKYALKTLENLKENGPKLAKLAGLMKSKIDPNTRPDIKKVAELSYDCMEYVAKTATPIHDIIINLFQTVRCNKLTIELDRAIRELNWNEGEKT